MCLFMPLKESPAQCAERCACARPQHDDDTLRAHVPSAFTSWPGPTCMFTCIHLHWCSEDNMHTYVHICCANSSVAACKNNAGIPEPGLLRCG